MRISLSFSRVISGSLDPEAPLVARTRLTSTPCLTQLAIVPPEFHSLSSGCAMIESALLISKPSSNFISDPPWNFGSVSRAAVRRRARRAARSGLTRSSGAQRAQLLDVVIGDGECLRATDERAYISRGGLLVPG